MLYALYVVLLKVRIRAEARVDMRLFFGFLGAFTAVLFWPIALALNALGIEHMALPSGRAQIVSVLVNVRGAGITERS